MSDKVNLYIYASTGSSKIHFEIGSETIVFHCSLKNLSEQENSPKVHMEKFT